MTRIILALTAALALLSCAPSAKAGQGATKPLTIAVFVPGVIQGSPVYEMLDAGVRRAAQAKQVAVKTIEGGTNQAQWAEQLSTLASSGEYALIVTSNPAMPELASKVTQAFPQQKFLILEAWSSGNPSIASIYYNHRELGYLHGALAGLLAAEKKAKPQLGLIVGQEYPEMNNAIKPGIEEGLKSVLPAGKVEFRVVGNWYDASKGEQLAQSLFSAGTEVVLTIAGGANQGVVTAAKAAQKKVLWYDTNAYDQEKGVIVGCGQIRQDKAAEEKVSAFLNGTLEFGKPQVVGVKEGYIDYLNQDPLFVAAVSPQVREKFDTIFADLKAGKITLAMPLPQN